MTPPPTAPAVYADQMPAAAPDLNSNCKRRSRRRRVFWASILAAGSLTCVVFHNSVLWAIAAPLVIDQRRQPASTLLMLDGDQRFDSAALRVSHGTHLILIRRHAAGRLERMGILRSNEEISRRELTNRRISDEQIRLLNETPISNSEIPSRICEWLRQHPGEEVDMLCDRFGSRRWDRRLQRCAEAQFRRRIRIVALPDRDFDEHNWWRSKRGTLAVLNGYLRLIFDCCHGDDRSESRECTTDDFDAAFMKRRAS